MRADVATLDLRLRRRSLVGYTVGLALYALLIVGLYPAFEHDTSLDALTEGNPTLGALLGATGSLTTPVGWLNANLYANFLPLFVLVMTIGYGADAIAGQDEANTLGLVATLPWSRRRLLLEKAAVLPALALPVSLVTMACVVVGREFDLDLDLVHLLGTSVGVVLLGVDFGLLAMVIGIVTGSRGRALGVAAGVAAASYVLSSLAPVIDWIRPLRVLSLFFHSVGNDQLAEGLSTGSLAVLLGAGVLLVVTGLVVFERFDVH